VSKARLTTVLKTVRERVRGFCVAHPLPAGALAYFPAGGCFLLIGRLHWHFDRNQVLALASVGTLLACLAGYFVGMGVPRRLVRPSGLLMILLPHALLTLLFTFAFLNPPFPLGSWERTYSSALVLPGAILFLFSNTYLASRVVVPDSRQYRVGNRFAVLLMTYGCFILGVWTGIATRGLLPFSPVIPRDRADLPELNMLWPSHDFPFAAPRNVERSTLEGKTVREILDTYYFDGWYVENGRIRLGEPPSPWEATIPDQIGDALCDLIYGGDPQW
jgi:hypothetical protein